MINIILCGGSGTRLWPLSRENYPKQFCNLIGDRSLYQYTLLRNSNLFERTIIITNVDHYSLAKSQAEELGIKNLEYILEPIGRNTAPAITIACFSVQKDEIIFVTPSDHFIGKEDFYKTLPEKVKQFAENNYLVTLGIKPSRAETCFGYIQAEGENVISFHEKPDEVTAKKYIETGNFYWNSGMFSFKAEALLKEIKYHSNEIFNASQNAYKNREENENIIKIPCHDMEKIPYNSIDYAVFEKSKKIKIIPTDIGWSDLGSFESIYEISLCDNDGNVSSSHNILSNSKNNFIISKDKPIILIDINDLIVVNTSDALLISRKGSSHKIKGLITNEFI